VEGLLRIIKFLLMCRKHYIRHGPIQPHLHEYPKTNGRSFRHNWFEKYSWLEYSAGKDAAFCFTCRNFAFRKGSQSSDVFCSSGFNDWNKALAKNRGFDKHAMSHDHSATETAYRDYMTSKSVVCQLSEDASKQATQREMQIRKNRSILGRLFDITRLIGKLGMPFRGHREDADSHNKGLYRELVEFVAAAGDEVLNDHLKTMSANATYLSPTIQNQMIDTIGKSILESIVVKVQDAGAFSVLMDETTDSSHQEQLSVMVRFVDKTATVDTDVIKERLLGVVCATQTTGEALTDMLLTVIRRAGLRVEDIVGQGYDGGSNMSGANKGVQARVRELNPRALFIQCYAHCLNRALVNAVSSREHAAARNFFGIVELVYTFVEGSAARHHHFVTVQDRLLGTSSDRPLHLKGLCDTRWNCRSESLTRLANPVVYEAVLETVDYVADTTSDGSVRGIAAGLRTSLTDFHFIVQLFTLKPVMALVNEVSVVLQCPQLDILRANEHINCLSAELSALRSDAAWDSAVSGARQFADKIGLESNFKESRKRKVPVRLQNSSASASMTNDITTATSMRSDYYALIDRLTEEVRRRYPKKLEMFSPLQCSHMDILDAADKLSEIAATYGLNEDRLIAQWRLFRGVCGQQPDVSLAKLYVMVPREHEALRAAYQLLITLPVTSAGVERAFSKLSLIKSKLRTTMQQERLEALMFCAAEKDLVKSLSIDDLVGKFAAAADRRLDLA